MNITHNNGIYNDNQSVHNSNIQECIRNSIKYILSIKPSIKKDELTELILNNSILKDKTKQILMEYMESTDVQSILNITFKELLLNVYSHILSLKDSENIFLIMNQEMQDAECKCFTGRMSRLVNCLNGFDENIKIEISLSEQIGNVIGRIKDSMEVPDNALLKELVVKELNERGIDNDIINEWVENIV